MVAQVPDEASIPHRNGIAAIITAYNIGPILSDTILSVVTQSDIEIDAVVLVVDGCKLTGTTRSISERFTRAYSNFHTIWLENGGVSRARNIGVKWLLETFPALDAILMLDGDDLLSERTLSSTYETLCAARERDPAAQVGWVYFDQVQFGATANNLRYPQTFSRNRWLGSNLSQPSCLYATSLFHAGVFWDEAMRQGIEDWEFWHSAMRAGFSGVYNGDVTLQYRQLNGNRSSTNRRKDSLTKRYMRSKHAELLAPKALLESEAASFQRWAFYDFERETWRLTMDPALPGEDVGWDRVRDAFAARQSQYATHATMLHPYFPEYAALISPELLAYLDDLKIVPNLLFMIEEKLLENQVVVIEFSETDAASI
ncbi:MAG: glycosyltransferase family A protein, partial [Pseudomonadota bacterium]